MRLDRYPRLAVAVAVATLSVAVLTACGGGGGSADTALAPAAPSTSASAPPATSLAVSGTITGFGSVILDGKKYDDSITSVLRGNDPNAPAAGVLTDLKLGMRIEGNTKDGQLLDARISAGLTGPIGSMDLAGASFMVYGQTVKVLSSGATPTVFDGVAGLAGLAVADQVEVHGSLDASKALTATRIERKPRSEAAAGVRLGGLISQLDSVAKTFKLNDMTLNFSAATLLPTGVALANGQMFSAYGDTAPTAAGFKPKTVKVILPGDGAALEVGGRIMVFVSQADFTVSGVRIDASAATLDGGVVGDLAVGVLVSAAGTVSNGVLKAKTLRLLKTSADVLASLKGPVTEFVSAGSFKLRGALVDAGGAGVSFSGGTAADLGNGAWLQVNGRISGEVLKADSVVFQAPPVDKPVTLKGEIRDLNASTGAFQFLGVAIKLSKATVLSGGDTAKLANGVRVEVTGTPGADAVLLASKLVFLEALAPQASVLGGRLSDLSGSGFKLPGGLAVVFGPATVFEGGSVADLANGVAVLVKGPVNGASKLLTATWIEIEKAETSGVRVVGALGDFVSAANFRVGGQRIDASAAIFSDGTAADLANGRVLDVRGTVLTDTAGNKVVKASQVRFLNL